MCVKLSKLPFQRSYFKQWELEKQGLVAEKKQSLFKWIGIRKHGALKLYHSQA